MASRCLFSVFDVTRQVFHQTKLSIAIVNLKPLVPGRQYPSYSKQDVRSQKLTSQDVLVIPRRVVPRLTDLRPDEVSDLFTTVQNVGRAIERAYKADALTVSLQDGIAAGQTVPHVHIHILPRHTSGPFSEDKDAMYPALEASEERLGQDLEEQKAERDEAVRKGMEVPKDEDRVPRTEDEMGKEAQWLAGFF